MSTISRAARSYEETLETFTNTFPNTPVPQKPNTKKLKSRGSAVNSPRKECPTVLIKKKVTNIEAAIARSLNKSVRIVEEQSGLSEALHT